MSIARMAVETARSHRKGEITTEFARSTLVGLYGQDDCTVQHKLIIERAITQVTGIQVVDVTITEE